MKYIKLAIVLFIILFIVIVYFFNSSKIIKYKGIEFKLPFVNQKIRTDSSLFVIRYPPNGTSIFISDTKMTVEEFTGSYMTFISKHDPNVEKKILKVDGYNVFSLISKAKESNLEKIQILIFEKKIILKITGNGKDVSDLMDAVLKMHIEKNNQ